MTSPGARMHFKVRGISCAEEVDVLKRELGPLAGGEDRLAFDILNGRMTVVAAEGGATAEAIAAAVARTGMKAEPWSEGASSSRGGGLVGGNGQTSLTVASGVATLAAFVWHAWEAGGIGCGPRLRGPGGRPGRTRDPRILYAVAVLSGAWHILPKAWLALRRLRPDMNLLMTIAVLGAVAIGEWFEAATVAFLFAVSLALESWSVGRARRAVAALMDLAPPTARLLAADGDGTGGRRLAKCRSARSSSSSRASGSRSTAGSSTGASERQPGADHRRERAGRRRRPATKSSPAPSTATARSRSSARSRPATRRSPTSSAWSARRRARARPSEQWVERFARVYTPAVMAARAAGARRPAAALRRRVGRLVLPRARAAGDRLPVRAGDLDAGEHRGGARRRGAPRRAGQGRALRRGAGSPQGSRARQDRHADRRPARVVEVVPLGGHDERGAARRRRRAWRRAASTRWPGPSSTTRGEQGIASAPAEDSRSSRARARPAGSAGRQYWLGSHRYLEERGRRRRGSRAARSDVRAGRTVVVVGDESHVCGLIALADACGRRRAQAVRAARPRASSTS